MTGVEALTTFADDNVMCSWREERREGYSGSMVHSSGEGLGGRRWVESVSQLGRTTRVRWRHMIGPKEKKKNL